jgi:hypothetical protein
VQLSVKKRLLQRSFSIECIQNAESIAIVVASLAIKGYREVAEGLKRLVRLHGKRCYVVYVGHLNEFKLANFVDTIDCFTVIACPNSRESHFPTKDDNLLKPIVAPVEILLALSAIPFEHPYAFTTDFSVLVGLIKESAEKQQRRIAEADDTESSGGALVPSSGSTITVHSQRALDKLHQKSYLGLEPRIGQTDVQEALLDGRDGVARGYASEKYRQS